jgi:hypothetical protein
VNLLDMDDIQAERFLNDRDVNLLDMDDIQAERFLNDEL